MNRRFIIMLSIALLLALLAAWVANGWIQGRSAPDTTVPVIAANTFWRKAGRIPG